LSNKTLSTIDSGEHDLFLQQLKSSSALAFARSLFHAAEGKELFEDEFVFASAVSTYYSLFHLGAALMLAYFSESAAAEDAHASIRSRLEKKWMKKQRDTIPLAQPVRIGCSSLSHAFPDPAEAIDHPDVPPFLQHEIPEAFQSLGCRGERGTLRDMRDFVSYAPRMLRVDRQNILYDCQYEAEDFKRGLHEHLDLLDGFFHTAVRWMSQKSDALYQRILSGDFVLFEFAQLGSYHPGPVERKAWAIYRLICEHEGADWRTWRGEPGTWHMEEREERERYAEAIRRFGS
jgi:hypothetical protein